MCTRVPKYCRKNTVVNGPHGQFYELKSNMSCPYAAVTMLLNNHKFIKFIFKLSCSTVGFR